MPQVYGKKKIGNLNIRSIFTEPLDSQSYDRDALVVGHGYLTTSFTQGDKGLNLREQPLTSSLDKPKAEKIFPVKTPERKPLGVSDLNVRRSPRLAQQQIKDETSLASPQNCHSRKTTFADSIFKSKASSAPSSPANEWSKALHSPLQKTGSTNSASCSNPLNVSVSTLPSGQKFNADGSAVSGSSAKDLDLKSYMQPLLQLCNDSDGRRSPTPFQTWADELDQHITVSKIAEASYGEVYRLALRDPAPGFDSADESVLKILALKPMPSTERNLSPAQARRVKCMSAVKDVAGEVRLLRKMSSVPGFANFRDCRVMQGRFPKQFVSAWRNFNRNIRKSEFPDPGRKGSYHEEQLWAIVEMQDAGTDLEDTPIASVWHVWDIFWGTAIALAKGEEWAGFEHRDLHLGNICIKWRHNPGINTNLSQDDQDLKRGRTGAEVTLIDYTLSRATVWAGAESDCAFLDLDKDPELFEGDSDLDYQYDIYRYMRCAVLYGNPNSTQSSPRRETETQQSTPHEGCSPWSVHHALTNLVWLHFVLYKLTEQLIEWPSSIPAKRRQRSNEKEHTSALATEQMIHHLWRLLDLEHMKEWWSDEGLASATGLVHWAVEEGWLDQGDVLDAPGYGHDCATEEDLAGAMDQLNLKKR